jgi:hypothetical protein
MEFKATKAKRELIYAKVALIAPSGGGKTYSALRLATGMLDELKKSGLSKNGKILLANTEQSRGRYYANEFEYDIIDVEAPHNPEKYVELIEWVVKQDYPILILDSSSHEWIGKSGCLELHALAGGTYQSWAKVTPRHDKFIYALADSPLHVIATMRGKDQYEMERSETGKTSVKKLGVGAEQRSGVEYEFTVSFLIDQKTSLSEAQKDNTHLFEREGAILLTEKHGAQIIQWANSGEGYSVPVRSAKTFDENLAVELEKVVAMAKLLGGSGNEKLMTLLKEYDKAGNPNKIKDLEKLKELLSKLELMKLESEKEEEKENTHA